MTSIAHQVAGGPPIDGSSYCYVVANKLTSQVNAEVTSTYTYDNTGQLTGFSGVSAATKTYDANGNRTMTGFTTGTGYVLTTSLGATYAYAAEDNVIGQTQTAFGDVTAYAYRDRLVGATEKALGSVLL